MNKTDFDVVKAMMERFSKLIDGEVSYIDPEGREEFPYISMDIPDEDDKNRTIHVFFNFRDGDLLFVSATVTEN
jgi:hypothetical protein